MFDFDADVFDFRAGVFYFQVALFAGAVLVLYFWQSEISSIVDDALTAARPSTTRWKVLVWGSKKT